MTIPPLPRVLVTVGTDHHPFDRLMDWVDELVDTGVLLPDQILVQRGSSRPPRNPPARASFPRDDLLALMAHTDVVVGHGGPGTIMDARRAGRRPVIVPRLASRGEVVDDHQVTFARRLASLDRIVLAEDRVAFIASVRRGLTDPAWLTVDGGGVAPATGADDVARRIDLLMEGFLTAPRTQVMRRIAQLWKVQRTPRDQVSASLPQPKSRST